MISSLHFIYLAVLETSLGYSIAENKEHELGSLTYDDSYVFSSVQTTANRISRNIQSRFRTSFHIESNTLVTTESNHQRPPFVAHSTSFITKSVMHSTVPPLNTYHELSSMGDDDNDDDNLEDKTQQQQTWIVNKHLSSLTRDTDNNNNNNKLIEKTQKFNDSVNSSIGRCLPDFSDNILWNETEAGTLAVASCPSEYLGTLYRSCSMIGKWEQIDYSQCKLEYLEKMGHLITYHIEKNHFDGLRHLASEFADYLKDKALVSPIDRLQALNMLNDILKSNGEVQIKKEKDRKYVQALLRVCDIILARNITFTYEREKNALLRRKAVEILLDLTFLADKILRALSRVKKKDVEFFQANNIEMYIFTKELSKNINWIAENDSLDMDIFNTSFKLKLSDNEGEIYIVIWLKNLGELLNIKDYSVVSDIVIVRSISTTGYTMSAPFDLIFKKITFFRELPESSIILLNIVITIAVTQVIFMTGVNSTANQRVCHFVALTLHYFHLVTSFWLLIYSMHLYRRLNQCQDSLSRGFFFISWTCPLFIVIISFVVNPRGYETSRYCWLSIHRGMVLSFVVPVTFLIMINTVIMVMSLKTFFDQRPVIHKSEIDKMRISLRTSVTLLPFVAINWFFGVLSLEATYTNVFQYTYSLTNSAQITHSWKTKLKWRSKRKKLTAMKLKRTSILTSKPSNLATIDLQGRDSQPLLISAPVQYAVINDPCCSNVRT
ncbi:uncharacterized protein LOC111625408 [Centruroides sculpturatus]|uniref:uncharacterized protein LOC111625408 n=1 Tax=Centruroides sculpturatus TaxID=218467 RepID=UPI000C6EBBB2|nr:uncharacterized protein LOC111625408 [Centruroides sculpturatus]